MRQPSSPSSPQGQMDVDDEFGPYLIGDRVGSGGMGVVYRARDRRVPRQVALKILHPALAAEPQYRERFRRESAMLSAVEHPHIVPMYNAGAIDGRLFLDMRLLDGDDLQTRLNAAGPIALGTAQAMIEGLADALDFVHGRGVLHRDIKPKNIMLTGYRDFAYLLDFGIANAEHESGLTEVNAVVGSTDYMAPERFFGAPADRRSDIYALAAVLVAALTGRPPYPGRHEPAAAAQAHRDEDVPRPSWTNRELAPLDAVIARGMAKDPRDRYPRAREMAAAATEAFDEVRARALAGPVSVPVVAPPSGWGRPELSTGAYAVAPARSLSPPPVPRGWAPTQRAPVEFEPWPAPVAPIPSAPRDRRRAAPIASGLQWALAALAAAASGLLIAGLFAPIVSGSSGYVDRHSARDLAVQLTAPALLLACVALFRAGQRMFALAAGVSVAMTLYTGAYLLEVVGLLHRNPGSDGPARAFVVAALVAATTASIISVWCALRRGLGGRAALGSPIAVILIVTGAAAAGIAFRFARDGEHLIAWNRDPWSVGFVATCAATVVLALFVIGGRAMAVGALSALVLRTAVADGVLLSNASGRSVSGWLAMAGDAAVVLGGLVAYRTIRRPVA